MAQYKTVMGPKSLTLSHDGSYEDAVNQFAPVINREAEGGWKLHSIQPITLYKTPKPSGCLSGLLIMIGLMQRPAEISVNVNMLIFVKE